MLHKMSELRGWTHETMMKMDKRIFYRYFGYWYKDILTKEEDAEIEKLNNNEEKQWKTL